MRSTILRSTIRVGMIAATGVTFRPLEESVRDCVESLMSIGGVEPERTDEWKAAHKARL